MTVLLEVLTPAAETQLTSLARVRGDLCIAPNAHDDAAVNALIDGASAAIAAFITVSSVGAPPPTLGVEIVRERFRPASDGPTMFAVSRRPLRDVIGIADGGAEILRLQAASDGVIDIGVDATILTSPAGPDGAPFTPGHAGRAITIAGAGAAGADLVTTIGGVTDGQSVQLADPAATTVTAAPFTVENPAFAYEWRSVAGSIWPVRAGGRGRWAGPLVTLRYEAGWRLPSEAGRNLPRDIEDACLLLIRRRIEQLHEAENARIKAESFAGIGAWTYAVNDYEWKEGVPSDVAAMLMRYRRFAV